LSQAKNFLVVAVASIMRRVTVGSGMRLRVKEPWVYTDIPQIQLLREGVSV